MEKQKTFDFKSNEVSEVKTLYSNDKKKKRIALSPSTLNIFRECPRCFWLHINRGIKRPRGAFPSIASGLDNVIKEYFHLYREEGILPPLLKGKIDARLISPLPENLYYNDNSQNAFLWGMLDECLILPGEIYAPLDYKTRRSFPGETHPSYQLQMDVYTLLLEKNNYKTRGLSYLLYFVPDCGELHDGIPFNVQLVEVKTSIKKALDIFQNAIEILKNPIPNSTENCEYCSWLKEYSKL